ncbi:MAG: TonB family protein [Zoogloea sp.]|uniref:energy transducer TonB n=1 Tax=Zoogloea sp. TaxID=49181 RepID=UPI00261886EA|nr:energy transducer TonB [Zoogloea sp.]MDD3329494.1 TonB family protein [Zoogloea sp.]
MNTLADRRFQHMLGLSVLLHGALLVALPRPPLAAPELPQLLASIRLVMPEVSAPAPSAAPAAQPVPVDTPRPAVPAPRPPRAEAKPVLAAPQPSRPVVRQRPAAATPLESAAQPTTPPVSQPAMPTEIAAAPRSADATPAPPATTSQPTAQRASTEAIDSYRRQLTDLFAREHEYPRVAAMRGWEGEVRLRLRVARRGQLLGVRVDRSSGFEVLDQDALALLEGHGKLPPLPDALEVAEIEVVVPITYRLRKAT